MRTSSFLSLTAILLVPLVFAANSGNSMRSQQAPATVSPSPQPGETPQGEENQPARQEAEEGIKHLLVSQIEAWNQGKLEGFMQGYWHSPELTFFSGATITKGWEPTLERYRQRYRSEGKEMGKLEFQDLNIDLLSRRAAVVTGKFQLTMSNGQKPHGVFTLIVKRMLGGWRIVHDHTSAAE